MACHIKTAIPYVGGLLIVLTFSGVQIAMAENPLAIEIDRNPAHQHLSYQGILIANQTGTPQKLENYEVTFENKKLYTALELCDLDSNCDHLYKNTCQPNTILSPNSSCELWVHAYADNSLSLPTEGSLKVNVNNINLHNKSHVKPIEKKFQLIYSQNLYAGGGFESPGLHIAGWDGKKWFKLGKGLEGGDALSLAEYQGDLYVAGTFYQSGQKELNYIARWNGVAWESLSSGVGDGEASSLAALDDSLYVGGGFDTAGGVSAHYIAEWKEGAWQPNDFTFDGPINVLSSTFGTFYAGGEFNGYIAQWNHGQWENMGVGLNSAVRALAVDDHDVLYAGGLFDHAGDVQVAHVAQWKNNQWYSLGSGVNEAVLALAAHQDTLYVGGRFTQAGSLPANYIAQWNLGWDELAGGLIYGVRPSVTQVLALTTHANTLYAGGYFTQANNQTETIPVNYIAAWDIDKKQWRTLDTGVNGVVNSLIVMPEVKLD